MTNKQLPEGFTYAVNQKGVLTIWHHGRLATTIGSKKASATVVKLESLNEEGQQQLMARLTGNYKRGNEGVAKGHQRNA